MKMNTSDWDHKEKKQNQKQELRKRQKSNNEDIELRELHKKEFFVTQIKKRGDITLKEKCQLSKYY